MKNIKDRKVYYKNAIGLCKPKKKPVIFLGEEEGKMSSKILGEKGWGMDPIFIPKGKTKTYGQIRKPGDIDKFRKISLLKLKKYLMENEI